MYFVECRHLRPAQRKGDLEQEEVLVESRMFPTKKAAKSWVLWQTNGRKIVENWNTGKKPSYVYFFTGKEWTNENSGEKISERYCYKIVKA